MSQEQAQASYSLKPVFEENNDRFRLIVRMTPDKLKLFVDATPKLEKFDPPLSAGDFLSPLSKKFPKSTFHGAVLSNIAEELNKGTPALDRRVASGRAPRHGKEGKLLLLVKPLIKVTDTEKREGIDPHYVRLFDNIEKGETVARIYPPVPGEDGMDALGNPMKASTGKPLKLKLAPTLSLHPSETGQKFENIKAEVAGCLTEEAGTWGMCEHLVFPEDIDLTTGDIDFVGSVTVKGSVMKGFTVRARGTIEVEGDVIAGTVISTAGAVRINGAVNGDISKVGATTHVSELQILAELGKRKKPDIRSAGMLIAHSLSGVVAESRGDIVVTKEIRQCRVRSQALLRIPEGHIFDSECFTVCGIEAREIGTTAGSETIIHLVNDFESTAEYAEIRKQLRQHDVAEETLRLHLGPFADHPERLDTLRADHRLRIAPLLERLKTLKSSREAILSNRSALMDAAKHNFVFRANVLQLLHKGVEIQVGEAKFESTDAVAGPITVEYFPEKDEFEIKDLQSLPCINEEFCSIGAPPSIAQEPKATVAASNTKKETHHGTA